MNWDAIGAIAEILGAVAVIGTLIYLARQIGHSVGASRAATNRSLIESYEGINDLILANPLLVDTLKELAENPTGQRQSILVGHLASRWMNTFLSAEFAYRNGQISKQEFEFYKEDFKATMLGYPGLKPYFVGVLRSYPSIKDSEIFLPLGDLL